MTREEFKDLAMKIIAQQTFGDWKLFDSDIISNYGVVEYDDDDEYDVANGMPLDEFLDELYEVVNNNG